MYYSTSNTPVLNPNGNSKRNSKELLSRHTKGKKFLYYSLTKKSFNFAPFLQTHIDLKRQCKDPCSKTISSLSDLPPVP